MVYKLIGNWKKGVAFDLHTLESTYLGDDAFGHPHFDNQRSEMGELLYQLKYKQDKSAVNGIVKLLDKIGGVEKFDYIIPVPPTDKNRPYQPVELVASAISEHRGVKLLKNYLVNNGGQQLKNITDPLARDELLHKALEIVGKTSIKNKDILLFDDLYRSGSTLKVATDLLYNKGKARKVCVLTLTKTRSNA